MEYKLLWELGSSSLWSIHFIFCCGLLMLWPRAQTLDKKVFIALPRRQGRRWGKNVEWQGPASPTVWEAGNPPPWETQPPSTTWIPLWAPATPGATQEMGHRYSSLSGATMTKQGTVKPGRGLSPPWGRLSSGPWLPLCIDPGGVKRPQTCLLASLLLGVDVLIWREICTRLYLLVHPVPAWS